MDTASLNRRRYLKAPTIEQIDEFRKELCVSERQFERFYSMPRSSIYKIRKGIMSLSAIHWEIIYEKIIPIYGLGYQKYVKKPVSQRLSLKKKDKVAHNRLNKLKDK